MQQIHALFYESSLDELDETSNHTKISKSWNVEGYGYKLKKCFLPFDKKIISMGWKCLVLDVGHMCKKSFWQKHVWLSIETNFGIF